ncbi:MAG: chemotaxis protein CheD [Lachnospiraceae bacterium]|nr:chemotaxis protein CheD [Lachnospiraceae bacterium]
MADIVKVGMADLNVCQAPDGITTLGLGSCVGVALREPGKPWGGLAHVMLPDSKAITSSGPINVPKFADTGVEELVNRLVAKGCNKNKLVAKIAGGAQMFAHATSDKMMRVGDRNVEAVKKKLAEYRIPILAEDTGNNYGRTVVFYPETGDFVIRSVGKTDKTI